MVERYLTGRRNPLRGEGPDDGHDEVAERWLAYVVQHFGEGWLNAVAGARPIQTLWKRRDMLATTELLTLGHALERLDPHAIWLKDQIRTIKGNDKNNSAGSIFEILALAQFDSPGVSITPAKRHQAGFDGVLQFPSAARLSISLKRYGMSQHQAEVNRRAAALRADLAITLKSSAAVDGLSIVVLASAHPAASDWDQLRQVLRDPRAPLATPHTRSGGIWQVISGPLQHEDAPLIERGGSLVLQVLVPFHRNEADNLRDKLLDACRNLAKHAVAETPLATNVVYVHVPASASMIDCATWVQEWFTEFPNKPVSAVLLYQPAVTRTPDNQSFIYHGFQIAKRNHTALIPGEPTAVPNLSLPVGRVGTDPSAEQLVAPDGRALPLRGHHAYQGGDIFCEMISANGRWMGALGSPGPGVHVHAAIPKAFAGPSDDRRAVVQGLLPPSDDLLIL
jgi:hypothetical protein